LAIILPILPRRSRGCKSTGVVAVDKTPEGLASDCGAAWQRKAPGRSVQYKSARRQRPRRLAREHSTRSESGGLCDGSQRSSDCRRSHDTLRGCLMESCGKSRRTAGVARSTAGTSVSSRTTKGWYVAICHATKGHTRLILRARSFGEAAGLRQRIGSDKAERSRFQAAGPFDGMLGDDDLDRHRPMVSGDLGAVECWLKKTRPAVSVRRDVSNWRRKVPALTLPLRTTLKERGSIPRARKKAHRRLL
jgi:hypothetical protein